MPTTMRRILLIAVLAGALVPVAAASASEAGVLTDAEYQQLATIQVQYATKNLKSLGALEAAARGCNRVRPASALVSAERTDCRAAFAWLEDNARIVTKLKTCGHAQTVDARFRCLLPDYQRLSGSVRTVYHADTSVTRAAANRRLTRECVRALGDTPKALAAEERMAKDAAELVAAIRRSDVIAVQKYGGLYDAATADMEAAGSTTPLSACPRQ